MSDESEVACNVWAILPPYHGPIEGRFLVPYSESVPSFGCGLVVA